MSKREVEVVRRVNLTELTGCMPLNHVIGGKLVSRGRRDSWPTLSYRWRLFEEGPNFDGVGDEKLGVVPMMSIVKVATSGSDFDKVSLVEQFRRNDPKTYSLVIGLARHGQLSACSVTDGLSLVTGHRRAAATAIGFVIRSLPVAMLAKIETFVDDDHKPRGKKEKEAWKGISQDEAMSRAKVLRDLCGAFDGTILVTELAEAAGTDTHRISGASDRGQLDIDRIDQGYDLLDLPAANPRDGKQVNIAELARQAMEHFGERDEYSGKPMSAIYQIVRQRFTIAKMATAEEIANCKRGKKGFRYDELAEKYGVAFATKRDVYSDFPITASRLYAALYAGENGSRETDTEKFATLVAGVPALLKFSSQQLESVLEALLRVETPEQHDSRVAKSKPDEKKEPEVGPVQKSPHARSRKPKKVG